MKTLAILVALVATMASCRSTRYVEVPVSHHDTVVQLKAERDSFLVRDSIHVVERGDTVFLSRIRYVEKVRITHDSIYVASRDTTSKVVEVKSGKGGKLPPRWIIIIIIISAVVIYTRRRSL